MEQMIGVAVWVAHELERWLGEDAVRHATQRAEALSKEKDGKGAAFWLDVAHLVDLIQDFRLDGTFKATYRRPTPLPSLRRRSA